MAFGLAADDAFLSDSRAPNLSESHAREMRSTFSHSLDPNLPVAKGSFTASPFPTGRILDVLIQELEYIVFPCGNRLVEHVVAILRCLPDRRINL